MHESVCSRNSLSAPRLVAPLVPLTLALDPVVSIGDDFGLRRCGTPHSLCPLSVPCWLGSFASSDNDSGLRRCGSPSSIGLSCPRGSARAAWWVGILVVRPLASVSALLAIWLGLRLLLWIGGSCPESHHLFVWSRWVRGESSIFKVQGPPNQ